ncbi:MAG: hypothetical protein IBX70_06920 [Clostridia bacterium]|nr:hypothetical protein [Clostridia bacterium]
MKKVLSLVLAAVMIMTLSSSAIYAAPNNNPNASFNKNPSAFENKVKNKTMNLAELEALREQLRFAMINSEGLPYGLAKRMELPPGLEMLLDRGTLPHGIVKKLMDNYYPLPGKKTDFEVLAALIDTADAKADAAVVTEYKGGATTINTFKLAIAVAVDFAADYDDAQKAQIKTEIDKLKAAMKVFDDAKFAPEKLDEVKAILVKLDAYKTAYFSILTPAKQVELTNLITFINTFTRTNDPVKLTKGDYDKIVLEAKAFSDPLVVLNNKIVDAKILLYKDITDITKGYKETEGTTQGTYLTGSNLALENAITVAKTFVATHTTQNLIVIKTEVEAQVKTLNTAMETFKGNKILGAAEMSVVKMVTNILEDKYNTPYSTKLNTLITDLKFYDANSALFTVAVYDDLLDRTQFYINDLFDSIVLELEALIVEAKADLVDAPASAQKTALVALIVEIEDYIDNKEYKYVELVAYFNELVVAFNAL